MAYFVFVMTYLSVICGFMVLLARLDTIIQLLRVTSRKGPERREEGA